MRANRISQTEKAGVEMRKRAATHVLGNIITAGFFCVFSFVFIVYLYRSLLGIHACIFVRILTGFFCVLISVSCVYSHWSIMHIIIGVVCLFSLVPLIDSGKVLSKVFFVYLYTSLVPALIGLFSLFVQVLFTYLHGSFLSMFSRIWAAMHVLGTIITAGLVHKALTYVLMAHTHFNTLSLTHSRTHTLSLCVFAGLAQGIYILADSTHTLSHILLHSRTLSQTFSLSLFMHRSRTGHLRTYRWHIHSRTFTYKTMTHTLSLSLLLLSCSLARTFTVHAQVSRRAFMYILMAHTLQGIHVHNTDTHTHMLSFFLLLSLTLALIVYAQVSHRAFTYTLTARGTSNATRFPNVRVRWLKFAGPVALPCLRIMSLWGVWGGDMGFSCMSRRVQKL